MNILKYKVKAWIRPNSESDTTEIDPKKGTVYIRVTVNNERLNISTRQVIDLTQWDSKKDCVIKRGDAVAINNLLAAEIQRIKQQISLLAISGEAVTMANLKLLLNGEQVKQTHYLLTTFQEHNKEFEQLIGTRYSYGSLKNYKTTERFLVEFIRHRYKKQDVPLDQVNVQFCEQYFIWLTTVKTSKNNGAGKHIQRLKKLINYALKRGYITVDLTRSYSVKLRPATRNPLSWLEIKKIMSLQLSTNTLEQVRQVFIFQIFTGLSYADVKALARKHITQGLDGRMWIRMDRTKTRNTFTVPLLPPAVALLNLYLRQDTDADNAIFPVISNQKMNAALKVIQEVAGIDKPLHSHLPRHTFATTIGLENGVPMETISKMLGHTKLATTQIYGKVGEVRIGDDMSRLLQHLTNTDKI